MPVTASIAVGTGKAIYGLFQEASASKKLDKLLAEREAYKTPQGIYDVRNATASRAQTGFDATTRNYFTSQTDMAFDKGLTTAQMLGGDPNSAAALFDQKMQQMFKFTAEDHRLGLETFGKYVDAENALSANLAAEQKSKQDILRDKIQAAAGNKAAGAQNFAGGVSDAIGAWSGGKMAGLYADRTKAMVGGNTNQLEVDMPYQPTGTSFYKNYQGQVKQPVDAYGNPIS